MLHSVDTDSSTIKRIQVLSLRFELSALCDQFDRVKDDTVCRHCGKVVKNKGGNTSNLMANLKTKQFYRVKKYRYYRYFLYIDVGFFSISQQPKIKLNVLGHTTLLLIIATLRTGGDVRPKTSSFSKKNSYMVTQPVQLSLSLISKIEHSWCWHACIKNFNRKPMRSHHAFSAKGRRFAVMSFDIQMWWFHLEQ